MQLQQHQNRFQDRLRVEIDETREAVPSLEIMISGLDFLRNQPCPPVPYQLLCSQAGFKFAELLLFQEGERGREVRSLGKIRRGVVKQRFILLIKTKSSFSLE